MTLKGYLMVMLVATLLSAAAWLAITGLIDPYATNSLGLQLFYLTLFTTVMGAAAILGFVWRFVVLRQRLALATVIISFRQACLFAFFAITLFWLLARGWFSWLNIISLALALGALEFFLLNLKNDNSTGGKT